MNSILAEILPPAMGVAISPMPVMIVLLLLVARNVRSAVGYVIGWMLGILCVGILLVMLSDISLHRGDPTESFGIGVAMMLLGTIFLVMAALSLRGKRSVQKLNSAVSEFSNAVMVETQDADEDRQTPADRTGAASVGASGAPSASASTTETARQMSLATTAPLALEADRPGWMRALDRISPLIALAIALLSAFNPKNFSMIMIAVADIHAAGFPPMRGSIAYLNFVALSTVTVAAPLLYWAYKREGADAVLQKAERWLARYQSYIMAGLFLALGTLAILKGWARLPA